MLDPAERLIWEATFLEEGLLAAPAPLSRAEKKRIGRWAASMALIAEQLCPSCDDEDAFV